MGLAILVQGRALGIVAHANRTGFVNRRATVIEAVRGWAVGSDVSRVGAASCFDDGAKRLLHIFRHFYFVLARPPMKTEYWNAPLINNTGIDFAIGIFVGNHLS